MSTEPSDAERVYRATGEPTQVTVNGEPLAPRRDLLEHTHEGFAWGEESPEAAQLALALLADAYNDGIAEAYYPYVERQCVAELPADEWELTESELMVQWLKPLFDRAREHRDQSELASDDEG